MIKMMINGDRYGQVEEGRSHKMIIEKKEFAVWGDDEIEYDRR